MELSGKIAVITGASRGIGAGLAREFAKRGIVLALCARSPIPWPDGAQGFAATVDVGDQEQVDAFAREAADRLGPIDLWINNAGVLEPIAPLRDIAAGDFRDHLQVNVMGVVFGCQAYIAHIRRHNHRGVLINISSGAAWKPYAGWAAYCAGKAAVDRISEVIQLEEAEHLRVYAVAPGVIDTDMQTTIRSTAADAFPMVERFREMKQQNSFNTMPFVAKHILAYAFDPDAVPDTVVVGVPMEHDR